MENFNELATRTVVIVGGSTGIGLELVKHYLGQKDNVFLIGRSSPQLDKEYPNLFFFNVDFGMPFEQKTSQLIGWLQDKGVKKVDYLFLNSGVFCERMRGISDTPSQELTKMMNINVFGHKWVLDTIINNIPLTHCIASSSIAGVRARAGNGGYAITKATFNMTLKLYGLEHVNTFFSVLGLCVVDTYLGNKIVTMPMDVEYREQVKLRERGRDPKYWTPPKVRASQLAMLLEEGPENYLVSGEFREIRDILKETSLEQKAAVSL